MFTFTILPNVKLNVTLETALNILINRFQTDNTIFLSNKDKNMRKKI